MDEVENVTAMGCWYPWAWSPGVDSVEDGGTGVTQGKVHPP